MRWLLPLLLAVPLSAQTPVAFGRDTVLVSLIHHEAVVLPSRQNLPSGIPSGPTALPLNLLGQGFSGTMRYGDTLAWKAQLDSVRGKGSIFLALTTERKMFVSVRNGLPYFDQTKWRAMFDRLWLAKRDLIAPYFADKTITAVYLMDEPQLKDKWGADISPSQVDSVAGYVKSKWPFARIAIRVVPQWLVNTPNVDIAWAQWEGIYHPPSSNMTARQFADSNVRVAKLRNLSLVLAVNAPDGGDCSSKLPGTFFTDPNPNDSVIQDPVSRSYYRCQMSAQEIADVGTVFASEPYACAVSGWMTPTTFARLDVMGAWVKVVQTASARPAKAC